MKKISLAIAGLSLLVAVGASAQTGTSGTGGSGTAGTGMDVIPGNPSTTPTNTGLGPAIETVLTSDTTANAGGDGRIAGYTPTISCESGGQWSFVFIFASLFYLMRRAWLGRRSLSS